MCGIFALLNHDGVSPEKINTVFSKGKSRGPDNSIINKYSFNMTLGFHRLAINGLNNKSNQPLFFNNIILICNGEIYNYKKLYEQMNITPNTDSDCEVIIHLFLKYGIDQTLEMLDGVFSFVLYDSRGKFKNYLYVARDAIGVRPLYYLRNLNAGYFNEDMIGFASELKCLDFFVHYNKHQYKIEQFKPGSYSVFETNTYNNSLWKCVNDNKAFYTLPFSYNTIVDSSSMIEFNMNLLNKISYHLSTAVNS